MLSESHTKLSEIDLFNQNNVRTNSLLCHGKETWRIVSYGFRIVV